MDLYSLIVLILIGLVAGILGGLLGLGGGLIMIPALIFFMGLSQHQATGTSLAVMLQNNGREREKKLDSEK